MKLYSPDGSSEVDAHPSKVDHFLANGWKVDKKQKKAKKEVVAPEIDTASGKLDEIKEPE